MSGHVTPKMREGGHLKVTTVASTAFTAFASQGCKQLTIANDTAKKLQVRQDGAGEALPIGDGTYYTFYGLTNANRLAVRTSDSTAVDVYARWED